MTRLGWSAVDWQHSDHDTPHTIMECAPMRTDAAGLVCCRLDALGWSVCCCWHTPHNDGIHAGLAIQDRRPLYTPPCRRACNGSVQTNTVAAWSGPRRLSRAGQSPKLSKGRVRATLGRIASRLHGSAWSASIRPLPSPPAHRAAARARSPEGSRSPAGWDPSQ